MTETIVQPVPLRPTAGMAAHRDGRTGTAHPTTAPAGAPTPLRPAAVSTSGLTAAGRGAGRPAAGPPPGPGQRPAEVVVVGTGGARIVELLGPLPWLRPVRAVPSVGMVPHARADLVILRTDTPARDLHALARLPVPPRAVLVVSGVQAPQEIVDSLRAGATSYLVDGLFTRADLVAAVLGTLSGQSHLSQPAVTAVVRQTRERTATPAERVDVDGLSQRQQEIMALLAAGRSNGEIATRLFLAEKTVRNHISAIYAKLRVRTRAEAIVYWLGAMPRAEAS